MAYRLFRTGRSGAFDSKKNRLVRDLVGKEFSMRKKLLIVLVLSVVFTAALFGQELKIGFVYVGPIGDHGWTYQHDRAGSM